MRVRRSRLFIGLGFAWAIAMGCAAALDHPTVEDAQWASARWPDTSLEDLRRGRALYVDKCAGCHNLHLPEAYPPDAWESYVAYMVADAKITPEEQEAITRFLASASARARGLAQGAGAGSASSK